MKVLVTGASGFIGGPTVEALKARGDQVVLLSRRDGDLESTATWLGALKGCDAVVHLAGEPVAGGKWDAKRRQAIRDSRVESTRALVEAMAGGSIPKVLVCASGIDYYPFAAPPMDDDEVTERDPPAESFLGRVCRDWEKEALSAPCRVVCLRIGVVLGPGGALERIVPSFKRFAGGKLGNGKQWFSWVHRDDVVGMIVSSLDDDRYKGPINAVTESVRYKDFAHTLGHVLHRPSFWRVPGFAVRLVAGDLADHLLHGRRVMPSALQKLNYTFKYPQLEPALAAALQQVA